VGNWLAPDTAGDDEHAMANYSDRPSINALGRVDERLRLLAREAPRAYQRAHLDDDGVRQVARGNLLRLVRVTSQRAE